MTLPEVRVKIDEVDSQIKPLFLKRMECAYYVAEAKAVSGADVFAPKRETEIIQNDTADVDPQVRGEYTAFLQHLMSLSRHYQYGMLKNMQDKVITDALAQSGLDGDAPHSRIRIRFSSDRMSGSCNLVFNMTKLNDVIIDSMNLESRNDRHQIVMVIEGNLKDSHIRQLLCQIGKETDDFAIQALM